MRLIVGEMNSRRRDVCVKAFDKLDRDLSGTIDLVEVRAVYSAEKHPDVLLGKKTEDEVLYQFLDTF